MSGQIFDIQRFSLHDGPGIRTTVFFQGCPLRCRWCHNPEGLSGEACISFSAERCRLCGACAGVCRSGAHELVPTQHHLNREQCKRCGACVAVCSAGALERVGRTARVGEILEEVLKDSVFYRTSGGGLTVSGGEPTLQIDFLEAILQQARGAGLHCAVETCAHTPWERLDRIRGLVDLFLIDLKETDPERHREYTGVSNDLILANLRRLHDVGASIILRLPLIPTLNDRAEHFAALAALVRTMPSLRGVEIMAYHALGESKRTRLGLDPSGLPAYVEVPNELIASWQAQLRELGVSLISVK